MPPKSKPKPRPPPAGREAETPPVEGTPGPDQQGARLESMTASGSKPVFVRSGNQALFLKFAKELDDSITLARKATDEERDRKLQKKKWLIGTALMWFAGPHNVYAILDLDADPNRRINPRDLSAAHIQELAVAFSDGGKRDRQSPIRILLSRASIEPRCLELMPTADLNDPDSEIPPLRMMRSEFEKTLEEEVWHQFTTDGKTLLSDNQVEERKAVLLSERNKRKLGTLINGNHRVHAMIKVSEPLFDFARQIVLMERNQVDQEEVSDAMIRLQREVENAFYAVEVYEEHTPPEVLAWLSENDPDRPNYKPRSGEFLWSLVQKQESTIQKWMEEERFPTRVAGLNFLNSFRAKYLPSADITDSEARAYAAVNVQMPLKDVKPLIRMGGLSDASATSLLTLSTTMEMIVDTCVALEIYSSRLLDSHVRAMKSEPGASFVAHFWLGTRTLIQIANVTGGERLDIALEWIAQCPVPVPTEGYQFSIPFWNDLHRNPQRVPSLLNRIEETAQAEWEKIFLEELGSRGLAITCRDYASAAWIDSLRASYRRLSGRWTTSKDIFERKLAASMWLYSALPLYETGTTGPAFYTAAMIPARGWIAHFVGVAKRTESLASQLVDVLFEKYQLPWTVGVAGTKGAHNKENWYWQAKGGQQLLQRAWLNVNLGSVSTRLQVAINALENPLWVRSHKMIQDSYGQIAHELRTRCSSYKTAKSDFPVLDDLSRGRLAAVYPDPRIMRAEWDTARNELRTPIFTSNKAMHALVDQHAVLRHVFPPEFWGDFDFHAWATGWEDTAEKKRGSIVYGLGIGLYTEMLIERVLRPALDSLPETRYLLQAVEMVSAGGGTPAWWADSSFPREIPENPSTSNAGDVGTGPARAPQKARKGKARMEVVLPVAAPVPSAAPAPAPPSPASSASPALASPIPASPPPVPFSPQLPPGSQPQSDVEDEPEPKPEPKSTRAADSTAARGAVGSVMVEQQRKSGEQSASNSTAAQRPAKKDEPAPGKRARGSPAEPPHKRRKVKSSATIESEEEPDPESEDQEIPLAEGREGNVTSSLKGKERAMEVDDPGSIDMGVPITVLPESEQSDDEVIEDSEEESDIIELPSVKRDKPSASQSKQGGSQKPQPSSSAREGKQSNRRAPSNYHCRIHDSDWAEEKTAQFSATTKKEPFVHEVLRKANPGHILFAHRFSHVWPSSRYHCDKYNSGPKLHDHDDLDYQLGSSGEVESAMSALFGKVESARESLRNSVVDLAKFLHRLPFGCEFAATGLTRTVENFKDIYVMNVADAIRETLNADDDQWPLAEAVWTAAHDGLYEAKLIEVDFSDGELTVDLLHTFPKCDQERTILKNTTQIHIGYLAMKNFNLEDTVNASRHFLPLHGYGRDVREAERQGVHAVRHRQMVAYTDQLPGQVATTIEPPSIPFNFFEAPPVQETQQQALKERFERDLEWKPAPDFPFQVMGRRGGFRMYAEATPLLSTGIVTMPRSNNMTQESAENANAFEGDMNKLWKRRTTTSLLRYSTWHGTMYKEVPMTPRKDGKPQRSFLVPLASPVSSPRPSPSSTKKQLADPEPDVDERSVDAEEQQQSPGMQEQASQESPPQEPQQGEEASQEDPPQEDPPQEDEAQEEETSGQGQGVAQEQEEVEEDELGDESLGQAHVGVANQQFASPATMPSQYIVEPSAPESSQSLYGTQLPPSNQQHGMLQGGASPPPPAVHSSDEENAQPKTKKRTREQSEQKSEGVHPGAGHSPTELRTSKRNRKQTARYSNA